MRQSPSQSWKRPETWPAIKTGLSLNLIHEGKCPSSIPTNSLAHSLNYWDIKECLQKHICLLNVRANWLLSFGEYRLPIPMKLKKHCVIKISHAWCLSSLSYTYCCGLRMGNTSQWLCQWSWQWGGWKKDLGPCLLWRKNSTKRLRLWNR